MKSIAVASRSSGVLPVEARARIAKEIATIPKPMSRCFLIFIVRAPSLKHHHRGSLLDVFEGDRFAACLLEYAEHIREGSVE